MLGCDVHSCFRMIAGNVDDPDPGTARFLDRYRRFFARHALWLALTQHRRSGGRHFGKSSDGLLRFDFLCLADHAKDQRPIVERCHQRHS